MVCFHIVDTLHDDVARGFRWSLDEDGEYQATCDACSDMADEDWNQVVGEYGRLLCFECFSRAASLNGVTLEVRH